MKLLALFSAFILPISVVNGVLAAERGKGTIPLKTLVQLLNEPHERLAQIAHKFKLNVKTSEFIYEDAGTIETCFSDSVDAALSLCKVSVVGRATVTEAVTNRRPMAILLASDMTLDIREYERMLERVSCEQRVTDEVLDGTSAECKQKEFKMTLQKRTYGDGRIGYQVLVEKP